MATRREKQNYLLGVKRALSGCSQDYYRSAAEAYEELIKQHGEDRKVWPEAAKVAADNLALKWRALKQALDEWDRMFAGEMSSIIKPPFTLEGQPIN